MVSDHGSVSRVNPEVPLVSASFTSIRRAQGAKLSCFPSRNVVCIKCGHFIRMLNTWYLACIDTMHMFTRLASEGCIPFVLCTTECQLHDICVLDTVHCVCVHVCASLQGSFTAGLYHTCTSTSPFVPVSWFPFVLFIQSVISSWFACSQCSGLQQLALHTQSQPERCIILALLQKFSHYLLVVVQ